MQSTDQIIHQCNHCEYNSTVKSNLTRHVKTIHSRENPQELVSSEKLKRIMEKKNDPPPVDDQEQIDLDDYINERLNQLLKDQNLPPVKVSKDTMKSLFTSTPATFVAGSVAGYILSQILPPFFFSIKQKALLLPKQVATQAVSQASTNLPIEHLA